MPSALPFVNLSASSTGTINLSNTAALPGGGQPLQGVLLMNLSGYTLIISIPNGTTLLAPWTQQMYPISSSTTQIQYTTGASQINGIAGPQLAAVLIFQNDEVPTNATTPVPISAGTTFGEAMGDVSGAWPNLTVVGIQNNPVSATAPNTGQSFVWNGSLWVPNNIVNSIAGQTGAVGIVNNSPLLSIAASGGDITIDSNLASGFVAPDANEGPFPANSWSQAFGGNALELPAGTYYVIYAAALYSYSGAVVGSEISISTSGSSLVLPIGRPNSGAGATTPNSLATNPTQIFSHGLLTLDPNTTLYPLIYPSGSDIGLVRNLQNFVSYILALRLG